MDIIEFFYQRVRIKQMLHVFIQAQVREFEYIPFIENKQLVHDSFFKIIDKNATKSISHIADEMCSPYKKRKYHKEDIAKCQIESLEKYNYYYYKNRPKDLHMQNISNVSKNDQKIITNGSERERSKSQDFNSQVFISQMGGNSKVINTSAIPNLFENAIGENKKNFIIDILKVVMVDDYDKDEEITLSTDQIKIETNAIKDIKKHINETILSAKEINNLQQAHEKLVQNITSVMIYYFDQFKKNELNVRKFQDEAINAFLELFTE